DDVRAALTPAEPRAHFAREAVSDLQPDQTLEVRQDVGADLERAVIGGGRDRLDLHAVVDREPDPHLVHRGSALDAPAPLTVEGVGLHVDDAALDVPKPVPAQESLAGDGARVQMLARRGGGKRHGEYSRCCTAAKAALPPGQDTAEAPSPRSSVRNP